MESKRKTRKVRKVASATQERNGSHNQQDRNVEVLIRKNGEAIEGLFASETWTEIVFPTLREMIAGVSGRFTNGRFFKGELTKSSEKIGWLAGYQCALEEFHNNLHDFIVEKDKLKERKRIERLDAKEPVYNPFLEELDEESKH